jgi:uncharacterized protein YndB with AHSA1/START domain
MTKNEAVFTKDVTNRTLTIVRPFNASLAKVWDAWTKSEILDQWWAPKPYRAGTVEMDFREGGHWRYYMEGPEGEKHYCQCNYHTIAPRQFYTATDMFCDEQGNPNTEFPSMDWKVSFAEADVQTTVTTVITFARIEDMEAIVKMGFEEGFTMGLGNLDEVLLAL